MIGKKFQKQSFPSRYMCVIDLYIFEVIFWSLNVETLSMAHSRRMPMDLQTSIVECRKHWHWKYLMKAWVRKKASADAEIQIMLQKLVCNELMIRNIHRIKFSIVAKCATFFACDTIVSVNSACIFYLVCLISKCLLHFWAFLLAGAKSIVIETFNFAQLTFPHFLLLFIDL